MNLAKSRSQIFPFTGRKLLNWTKIKVISQTHDHDSCDTSLLQCTSGQLIYLEFKDFHKQLLVKFFKLFDGQLSISLRPKKVVDKCIADGASHVARRAAVPVASTNRRRVEHDVSDRLKLPHVHFPVAVQVKHLKGNLKVATGRWEEKRSQKKKDVTL